MYLYRCHKNPTGFRIWGVSVAQRYSDEKIKDIEGIPGSSPSTGNLKFLSVT
jgi:hypothetical protein